MDFGRHDVREFVKAERRLVAVDSFWDFLSILRPEIPQHQVRPLSGWKVTKPVDAPVLSDPIPGVNVVGACLFREPRPACLPGGKVALLRLR